MMAANNFTCIYSPCMQLRISICILWHSVYLEAPSCLYMVVYENKKTILLVRKSCTALCIDSDVIKVFFVRMVHDVFKHHHASWK